MFDHLMDPSPPGPGPDRRDAVRRGAARIRRRRRFTVAASVTVAAALATFGGLVVADRHPKAATVSVRGAQPHRASASSPSVTLPPRPAPPAGSVPEDFGLLRLWIPGGWVHPTQTSSCTQIGAGDVSFGAPGGCWSDRPSESRVVVSPLSGSVPRSWTRTSINGVHVFTRPVNGNLGVSTTTVWDVPALGVSLAIVGVSGLAVARTLGPSSLSALLALRGPLTVPTGWPTVSFGGLSARVPPAWPSADEVVCAGLFAGGPRVFLGRPQDDAGCATIDENGILTANDGLMLAGKAKTELTIAPGSIVGRVQLEDGSVTFSETPTSGPEISAELSAGARWFGATIGLGVDPVVAEEVLSSLHVG